MGRPSKLTEQQWSEIEKRLIAGESLSALAVEYKIGKGNISTRLSKRVSLIKASANQVVTLESQISGLSVSEQVLVFDLASQLRAISSNLGKAASAGAESAAKLNLLAVGQVNKLDPEAIDHEALKGIAALHHTSNLASSIGMDLLRINKESVERLNDAEPEPKQIVFTVKDARKAD